MTSPDARGSSGNSGRRAPLLCVVADWMDGVVRRLGYAAAALNLVLIAVILAQVGMRHLFSGGHQIVLGELEWHLYATAMLFGMSYSQCENAHVRVDALARNWTPERRAAVEIFGTLFFMAPFVAIVFFHGLEYVADSWRVSERSDSPAGLPFRWLIKSIIPASFALWFFALTARLLRDISVLRGDGGASAQERGERRE